MAYTGRFAPSPTGSLHLGSLLAALASFLDARSNSGRWLVRIDDIDPPREVAGAAAQILRQLETHGLHWDGAVIYQSARLDRYHAALVQLAKNGHTYPCQCSRAELLERGPKYDGHCLRYPPSQDAKVAIRVKADQPLYWLDLVQNTFENHIELSLSDFVVLRKDGLVSYQLAAAIDDCSDQISHVVRGADLLESTPRQLLLMRLLERKPPQYAHLPILTDNAGEKLSKQLSSTPIDAAHASRNIAVCLESLGQKPPAELGKESVFESLKWATKNWDLNNVPRRFSLPYSTGK